VSHAATKKEERMTAYQHLMIDLETLGKKPGCAIVQLGACLFNIDESPHEIFCESLDLQSSIDLGLYIDGSTINWWMHQSGEARYSVFDGGERGVVELDSGIALLLRWLSQGGLTDFTSLQVWSHGLAFDVPILEHAMAVCGIPVPWSYKNLRDTRTLAMLAPDVERYEPAIPHNAGADATAQALWVRDMLNALDAAGASSA